MSSRIALPFLEWIEMLTEEIIIAKADADHDPTLEKHEYIESLYRRLAETMK